MRIDSGSHMNRRLWVIGLAFVASSGGYACNSDGGTSVPTGVAMSDEPPPLSLDLVGTSSPGDVWTMSIDNGTFELAGDNGTPSDTSDDATVTGRVASSVATAMFTPSQSTIPALAMPFVALALPGFGYVIPTADRLITAIQPGTCVLPSTSERYVSFAMAAPTRPNTLPHDHLVIDTDSIQLENALQPNLSSTFTGAGCTGGRITVSGATVPAGYGMPVPANVYGQISSNGSVLLDMGRGFGGLVAVPEDRTTSEETMYRRVRLRRLIGYIGHSVVHQPVGADVTSEEVERAVIERNLRIEVVMGDGLIGTMSMFDGQSGVPVLADQDVNFAFADGGATMWVNQSTSGDRLLQDASFVGGLIVDGQQLSIVLTGRSERESDFKDALEIDLPAGREIWRDSYSGYLRFVPPRGCYEAGLALPDVYTANLGRTVASTRGFDIEYIDIRAGAGGQITTNQVLYADGRLDDLTIGGLPNFYLLEPGQTVRVVSTLANPIRLYCGPEWPWNPQQDAYGAVEGFDSGQPGLNGFTVPGLYIVEIGQPGGIGGGGATYLAFSVGE